jgi:putative GTP pyrophosphokinase
MANLSREEIAQIYQSRIAVFEGLQEEAVYEIKNALNQTSIKYHSITARIKKLESLVAKVESKQIEDPFSELKDIVGTRIVTLFLSDIDKIIAVLKSTFDISNVDNKIDDSDPRLFGYFSVHLIANIKASFSGTRYDKIKPQCFEIQIRTIAMDAWASASHYLDYKSEADVPEDLRRDFNALSGLYYVADKHFEMFFRSRAATLEQIDRSFEEERPPLNSLINFDILMAFLKDRYPDREAPDSGDLSDLLGELRKIGIPDLGTLVNRLDATENWFVSYETNHPPRDRVLFDENGQEIEEDYPGRFTATGAVRVRLDRLAP